jgi:hypothetical protein
MWTWRISGNFWRDSRVAKFRGAVSQRPHDFRQDDTRSNSDGKIVGEPDFDNARTRPITGVFDRPQKLAQRGMDFF